MRKGTKILALVAGLLAVRSLAAQGETPTPKLYGSTKLAPPAAAENQDAAGFTKLLQWGERMAIHVHVRHLEPGATYEVAATRKGAEDQDETAVLGTITTRTGTPPPPRCYRASLKPVVEEPPPAGGNFFPMGGHGFPWDFHHAFTPGGFGLLLLNKEGTELRYDLHVWAKVTEAALVFGTGDPVPLPLDEELEGSLAISAEQLASLAAGEAVLEATIAVEDEEGVEQPQELSGAVKPCFPWLEEFRERMAALLSGTGALLLDTKREDEMPFGVTDLRDLVGAALSVKDGSGTVVLEGTIGELKEFPTCKPPAGGGAVTTTEEDEVMAVADANLFFGITEVHDASFLRGDANEDGRFDLSDPIASLQHIFLDGPAPYCADAGDANDSGDVDISDPVFMIISLYKGTGSLRSPYPRRGFDSSPDGLFCGQGQ